MGSSQLARSSAAALLASLLVTIPAAAQSPAGRPSAVRIDNFGRVNANYYRGAQPEGQDYKDLAVIGVKTVIDLTEDGDVREPSLVRGAGMQFFRIPMTTHETPSSAKIAQFLTLVNDPANQPVYVHCQGGRHRTGVMTAVYRMTDDGWTADRAFAEMKQYKFGMDILHSEFKDFVYAYHATPMAVATSVVAKEVPNASVTAQPAGATIERVAERQPAQ